MYLVLGHADEHSAPMNNTVLQVCSPFKLLIPKPYRQTRKANTSNWDFKKPIAIWPKSLTIQANNYINSGFSEPICKHQKSKERN